MNDKDFNNVDIQSYCTTDAEKKAYELFYQFFEERNFTELETRVFSRIDTIIRNKHGDGVADALSDDIDYIKELCLTLGFIEACLCKESQFISG